MTLVQTLMTEELVVLVADRRLTWPDGSVADDNFTKVVLWRDGFVAGFTGIARINPAATKSTSEWIAEVLADHRNFNDGAVALQRSASEMVSKLRHWPDLRLAIILAGFDFRRYPRFAMVSNFLPGGPYPADPKDFGIYDMVRAVGPGVKSAFATAGATLNGWQGGVLGRTVPRMLGQSDGITRAARLMVALQRKVADAQPTVGRDAMCVVVPRERSGMRGIFGRLNARTLHARHTNFCYFEDDAYSFKQLGPHIATGDGRAIADFYGVADPEDLLMQTVGIKFLKTGPYIPGWDVRDDLLPGLQNLAARHAPSPVLGPGEEDGPYGFGYSF